MIPEIQFELIILFASVLVPAISFSKGICSKDKKASERKLNRIESIFLIPFSLVYIFITTKCVVLFSSFFNFEKILGFYYRFVEMWLLGAIFKNKILIDELIGIDRCSLITMNQIFLVGILIFTLQFIVLPYRMGVILNDSLKNDLQYIKDLKEDFLRVFKIYEILKGEFNARYFSIMINSVLVGHTLFFIIEIFLKLPFIFLDVIFFLLKQIGISEKISNFLTTLLAPSYFRDLDENKYLYIVDVAVSDTKLISGALRDFEFSQDKQFQALVLEKVIRWERFPVQISKQEIINASEKKVETKYKFNTKDIPGDFFVVTQNSAKEININKLFRSVVFILFDIDRNKLEEVSILLSQVFEKAICRAGYVYSNVTFFYPEGEDDFVVELTKEISKKVKFLGKRKYFSYKNFNIVQQTLHVLNKNRADSNLLKLNCSNFELTSGQENKEEVEVSEGDIIAKLEKVVGDLKNIKVKIESGKNIKM